MSTTSMVSSPTVPASTSSSSSSYHASSSLATSSGPRSWSTVVSGTSATTSSPAPSSPSVTFSPELLAQYHDILTAPAKSAGDSSGSLAGRATPIQSDLSFHALPFVPSNASSDTRVLPPPLPSALPSGVVVGEEPYGASGGASQVATDVVGIVLGEEIPFERKLLRVEGASRVTTSALLRMVPPQPSFPVGSGAGSSADSHGLLHTPTRSTPLGRAHRDSPTPLPASLASSSSADGDDFIVGNPDSQ